jgi:hypothetical protein
MYNNRYNDRLHKTLKQKVKKCLWCGEKEKTIVLENGLKFTNLNIHHIDGNKFNNDLDNLTVLCRNCHRTLGHEVLRDKKTGRFVNVLTKKDIPFKSIKSLKVAR